jgi:hypothetical protein
MSARGTLFGAAEAIAYAAVFVVFGMASLFLIHMSGAPDPPLTPSGGLVQDTTIRTSEPGAPGNPTGRYAITLRRACPDEDGASAYCNPTHRGSDAEPHPGVDELETWGARLETAGSPDDDTTPPAVPERAPSRTGAAGIAPTRSPR